MAGSGQDVNLRQSTFPPADEAVPPAQDGRTTTGQFAAGNLHGKATRFKPGVSGNPAGRRPAGLSIREWANLLTDAPIEQLKAIDANPEPEPWSKVIAARWLLRSGTNDLSKGGWPLADKPLAELFDRTTGRPAPLSHLIDDLPPIDHSGNDRSHLRSRQWRCIGGWWREDNR